MDELQSTYGLVQLKHIDEYISRGKEIAELYRKELSGIKGIRVLYDIEGVDDSYTYFPLLVDESLYGESRDDLYERLKMNIIYSRRYFYFLISQFPTYRWITSAKPNNLSYASKISGQVICLPIYLGLNFITLKRIIKTIKFQRT